MANPHIRSFDGLVIPCPLYGFSLRHVKKCIDCDHYLGIQAPTVNGQEIESEDLLIRCGKPITRRMQRIIEE